MKHIFILVSALIILTGSVSPLSAEPVAFGVLPFDVTSESDLEYLKEGLIDLFSSRLSKTGEVSMVDKAIIAKHSGSMPYSTDTALSAGKQAGADFVLYGALTESVKGITISVSVVEVSAGKESLTLSEESGDYETADVIIPLVNRISNKINQKLFSREIPEEVESIDKNETFNVHEHPDKLIDTLDLKD